MARSRGLPKSPQARYAKWQAKYDPTVVQSRFNEVSSVAQARAQAGIIAAAQAQQEIGAILDQYGVAGPARAVYLSFGMKVWHATQRLTGPRSAPRSTASRSTGRQPTAPTPPY
jgi:hypothetical protein